MLRVEIYSIEDNTAEPKVPVMDGFATSASVRKTMAAEVKDLYASLVLCLANPSVWRDAGTLSWPID